MRMGKKALSQRLEELKEKAKEADLPRIAEGLGYQLRREGRTYRIPKHGGLILWQAPDGLWRWTWFSQGTGGDAISFLQEFEGMSFKEAIEYLTGESLVSREKNITPKRKKLPQKKPLKQASQSKGLTEEAISKWRQKAKEFLDQAHKALFSSSGKEVLKWLKEKRGISERAIKRFRLGLSLEGKREAGKEWGLDKDKVWLPQGLVIPYLGYNGEIVGFLFRLFKPGEVKGFGRETKIRYYYLSLWERPVMTFGEVGSPLVIVESELDFILLSDLAEVNDFALLSLGSAGRKLKLAKEPLASVYLLSSPLVLVALDNDEAGKKASEEWLKTYRHTFKWLPVEGKDPTELWQRKGSLGLTEWLFRGFEEAVKSLNKSFSKNEEVLKTYFFLTVDYFSKLQALRKEFSKKETMRDCKTSLHKENSLLKEPSSQKFNGKFYENLTIAT